MKCIDAIEGNARGIITRLHEVCVSERIEESEYIRWVKAVIDATVVFLSENMEIAPEPALVRDILFSHAKALWMASLTGTKAPDAATDSSETCAADAEYLNYYFNYLYHRGNFPP
jgi:hypothetical protein